MLKIRDSIMGFWKVKWLLLSELTRIDYSEEVDRAARHSSKNPDQRDKIVRYFTDRHRYVYFLKSIFYDTELFDLKDETPWGNLKDEVKADVEIALKKMWGSSKSQYSKNLSDEEKRIRRFVRQQRAKVKECIDQHGYKAVYEGLKAARDIEKNVEKSKKPHEVNKLFDLYLKHEKRNEQIAKLGIEEKYQHARAISECFADLVVEKTLSEIEEEESELRRKEEVKHLSKNFIPASVTGGKKRKSTRPSPPMPERLPNALPAEEDIMAQAKK